MSWMYLFAAAVFEVAFAVSMKASDGFTRPLPSVVTVIGVAGGIYFLTLALKELPVGVAYPIWVGAGALGAVLLGIVVFGETFTLMKLVAVTAIILGVIGLKFAANQ